MGRFCSNIVCGEVAHATYPPTLVQNISYTPWRALKSLQNGCVGSGWVDRQKTYEYNNRLQPFRMQLTSKSDPQ